VAIFTEVAIDRHKSVTAVKPPHQVLGRRTRRRESGLRPQPRAAGGTVFVTGEGLPWEGSALAALTQKERVTGIEPALSAWEAERCELLTGLACTGRAPRLTVRDRPSPRLTAR
jgi:hypothetical protein